MENIKFLNDAWRVSGHNKEEFKKEIAEIVDHTYFTVIESNLKENDGLYYLVDYNKGALHAVKGGSRVRMTNLPSDTSAICECLNSSRTILRAYDKSYILSENAYSTLFQRLQVSGEGVKKPLPERNDFLSALMRESEDSYTLCVRTEGGVEKVFAVHSGRYKPIEQSVMCSIADSFTSTSLGLGTTEFQTFQINHNKTSFIVAYPQYKLSLQATYGLSLPYVPAVRISLSDTALSSLTAEAVWLVGGNNYIIQDALHIRHTKGAEKKIAEGMTKKIFPLYTALPERLVKLMKINLTEAGKDNSEKIDDLFSSIFAKYSAVKTLGKTKTKEIKELLLSEMDFTAAYTAYEIATLFLDLPNRIVGLSESGKEALAQICGKVPFFSFKKDESSIFLTA